MPTRKIVKEKLDQTETREREHHGKVAAKPKANAKAVAKKMSAAPESSDPGNRRLRPTVRPTTVASLLEPNATAIQVSGSGPSMRQPSEFEARLENTGGATSSASGSQPAPSTTDLSEATARLIEGHYTSEDERKSHFQELVQVLATAVQNRGLNPEAMETGQATAFQLATSEGSPPLPRTTDWTTSSHWSGCGARLFG